MTRDPEIRGAEIEKELEQSGPPLPPLDTKGLPSLAGLIKERGALPEPEIVRIFSEVLDDLELAHSQAMLHRDISSVRVVRDGPHWKLADYGIAGLGTVRYMSPERCQGRLLDTRSDTYSLGVCMYEAATGRVPFDCALKFECIQAHVNQPPPPPRSIRPEISIELERIIMRSLVKNPQGRFQTARELHQALESLGRKHRPSEPARARHEVPSEPDEEALPPAPEPGLDAGPEPLAEEFVPQRRVKPGLVVALVAAALAAVAAFVFLPKMLGARLPDVVGLDRVAAQRQLGDLGQVVKFVEVADTTRAGRVVAQSPGAGTRLVRNGTVELSVSSGRVKVPQVAGATEEEARQRLAAAGITVSRVEAVYSDYYEAGMVTGSSPKAGMTLGWGEGVVLTVAAGRASCPQCGSRREAGARFCTRCGHKY